MKDPLTYCLVLLKRRLRSTFELDQAMKKKEVEPEKREEVIRTLTETGLLDDVRFAKAWVHTRDLLAPRGASLLRAELVQKGINKDLISRVLAERKEAGDDEEETDQPSEEAQVRRLVASRERTYKHLAPEVRNRRLTGFLMRRGFSYTTIRRILDS